MGNSRRASEKGAQSMALSWPPTSRDPICGARSADCEKRAGELGTPIAAVSPATNRHVARKVARPTPALHASHFSHQARPNKEDAAASHLDRGRPTRRWPAAASMAAKSAASRLPRLRPRGEPAGELRKSARVLAAARHDARGVVALRMLDPAVLAPTTRQRVCARGPVGQKCSTRNRLWGGGCGHDRVCTPYKTLAATSSSAKVLHVGSGCHGLHRREGPPNLVRGEPLLSPGGWRTRRRTSLWFGHDAKSALS